MPPAGDMCDGTPGDLNHIQCTLYSLQVAGEYNVQFNGGWGVHCTVYRWLGSTLYSLEVAEEYTVQFSAI